MITRLVAAPWGWFVVLIAVYLVATVPTLGQPLLESHAYRQTQTAFTAVLFARDGIDLLRPPLPILGPPGILPMEFPLFQAAASLLISAGLSADTSMRITGLTCFVGSAALVFGMTGRIAGPRAAAIALGAFLFNGHALLYGRTSLIEYLAIAGGLGFLVLGGRWLDTHRRRHWLLAFTAGAVGVLVKVTTGFLYLLPLLFWRSESGVLGYRRPGAWALVGMVAVVGLAWGWYSDGIRLSQPATEFLASRNQIGWFFGTPGQRMDPAEWRVPLVALLTLTGFGLVMWAPLALKAVRQLPQAPLLGSLLVTVLAGPLIFFNLYAEHDYYWAAVAPLIAVMIGVSAVWVIDRRSARWARLTTIGLAGAWAATLVGTTPTWTLMYREPSNIDATMRIAKYISNNSSSADWVVLDGFGWNSTFLYYAERRGFAVPDETTEQDTSNLDVDAILSDPVYGPFIRCSAEGECERFESYEAWRGCSSDGVTPHAAAAQSS